MRHILIFYAGIMNTKLAKCKEIEALCLYTSILVTSHWINLFDFLSHSPNIYLIVKTQEGSRGLKLLIH